MHICAIICYVGNGLPIAPSRNNGFNIHVEGAVLAEKCWNTLGVRLFTCWKGLRVCEVVPCYHAVFCVAGSCLNRLWSMTVGPCKKAIIISFRARNCMLSAVYGRSAVLQQGCQVGCIQLSSLPSSLCLWPLLPSLKAMCKDQFMLSSSHLALRFCLGTVFNSVMWFGD